MSATSLWGLWSRGETANKQVNQTIMTIISVTELWRKETASPRTEHTALSPFHHA